MKEKEWRMLQLGIKEKLKKIAGIIYRKLAEQPSDMSQEPAQTEETIELGYKPKEVAEEEREKRKNKEQENTIPSVVVKGEVEDKDEAALQYAIELIESGKKLDDAVEVTKQIFYKESASNIVWKNFCADLKIAVYKNATVKECPEGHKNSKGEPVGWCIYSEDDGSILSSHKTKEQATNHLRDIHGHK